MNESRYNSTDARFQVTNNQKPHKIKLSAKIQSGAHAHTRAKAKSVHIPTPTLAQSPRGSNEPASAMLTQCRCGLYKSGVRACSKSTRGRIQTPCGCTKSVHIPTTTLAQLPRGSNEPASAMLTQCRCGLYKSGVRAYSKSTRGRIQLPNGRTRGLHPRTPAPPCRTRKKFASAARRGAPCQSENWHSQRAITSKSACVSAALNQTCRKSLPHSRQAARGRLCGNPTHPPLMPLLEHPEKR